LPKRICFAKVIRRKPFAGELINYQLSFKVKQSREMGDK